MYVFDGYEPDNGEKMVKTILIVGLVVVGILIGLGIGLLI